MHFEKEISFLDILKETWVLDYKTVDTLDLDVELLPTQGEPLQDFDSLNDW